MRRLSIWWGEAPVGMLLDTHPLLLVYDAAWRAAPDAQPLTPLLPLTESEHQGEAVEAFFENLLPEGAVRAALERRFQATSTFGLLERLGGDVAGAISLLPEGSRPEAPRYREITWKQVDQLLRAPHEVRKLLTDEAGGRLSLSGAQNKLLLTVTGDGRPLLPAGATPSRHIVKPDIASHPSVWKSALNETLVMRLAGAAGLPTAEIGYRADIRSAVITRYDRIVRGDRLHRLHQADFCQLAGISSDRKYEADGGPSLARCYGLVRELSVAPAADVLNLTRWVFFNLYVANYDGHAKNLALLVTPEGARLAPFYDLVCTGLYPALSRRYAFSVGGVAAPGAIMREHLADMARATGQRPRFVLDTAGSVAAAVLRRLDEVVWQMKQSVGAADHDIIEQVARLVGRQTRRLAVHWGLAGLRARP